MKTYIGRFWRGNPQSANGGYETNREVEAKTPASAEKKLEKYENCVYGSMTLLEVKEKEVEK